MTDMIPICTLCGDEYTMETGHAPTQYCDACAHDAVARLTRERDDNLAAATRWERTAHATALRLVGEIAEWRDATGLECEGGPDGVTPEDLRQLFATMDRDAGNYARAIGEIEAAIGALGPRPLADTVADVRRLVADRDAALAAFARVAQGLAP